MSVYKIIAIEKAASPEGAGDGNWYNYIIANEHNTIVGYRNGSLHEVKLVAKDCVKHLNEKFGAKSRRDFVRSAYPIGMPESASPVSI